MTPDDLNTRAIEALRFLGDNKDDDEREEFMRTLLMVAYQAGKIDANDEHIRRNEASLKLWKALL